jgi:hypothetical protein
MKKLLLILTLCVGLSGYVTAQCTISQATITNASLISGVANFSLVFKHIRNSGNKWITIHMWKSTVYPAYGYGNPPTGALLSGVVPFGTIVINNSTVSGSGTYGATAFASPYQNDGTFILLNTSNSTIVYDASTDMYTLNNLQVTLPAGTLVIKFDTWSSQANTNQVVHCFTNGGSILVPTVLPVKGLEASFKVKKENGYIHFSWSTESELNNSHFEILKASGSDWVTAGILGSKYEDGNSSTLTNYSFKIPVKDHTSSMSLMIAIPLVLGMFLRKYVPMRVTCMLVMLWAIGYSTGCKKSNSLQEDELSSEWFRLKQVDRNNNSTSTTARMVKI